MGSNACLFWITKPDFYIGADIEQVVFENSEEKMQISNRLNSSILKKIDKNSVDDVVNELYEEKNELYEEKIYRKSNANSRKLISDCQWKQRLHWGVDTCWN